MWTNLFLRSCFFTCCLLECTLISNYGTICNIKSAAVLVNLHVPRPSQVLESRLLLLGRGPQAALSCPHELLYFDSFWSCPPGQNGPFSPMPSLTHKNRRTRHRPQILLFLGRLDLVLIFFFKRGQGHSISPWASLLFKLSMLHRYWKIGTDKKKKTQNSTVLAHFLPCRCCWFRALISGRYVKASCPERPASLFFHVLATGSWLSPLNLQ